MPYTRENESYDRRTEDLKKRYMHGCNEGDASSHLETMWSQERQRTWRMSPRKIALLLLPVPIVTCYTLMSISYTLFRAYKANLSKRLSVVLLCAEVARIVFSHKYLTH
jgi:hypothetical protein